jgi:hypothetical protein
MNCEKKLKLMKTQDRIITSSKPIRPYRSTPEFELEPPTNVSSQIEEEVEQDDEKYGWINL